MNDAKHRISRHVHVNQTNKSVTVWVLRSQDGKVLSCHDYPAYSTSRIPGFIARRAKRGIRMLNASLKREWGQG